MLKISKGIIFLWFAFFFIFTSSQLIDLISIQQRQLLNDNEEIINKISDYIQGYKNGSIQLNDFMNLLESYSMNSKTDPMGIASYNLATMYKSINEGSKYEGFIEDSNLYLYKIIMLNAAMRGSIYAYVDLAFMIENKWIQNISTLNEFFKAESGYINDEYVKFHPKIDSNSVASLYYHTAANSGHPLAQMVLGYRYDQGYRVKQNCEKAASWYEKAAESALDTLRNTHTSLFPYEGRLKIFDGKDGYYRKKMKDILNYYKYTANKDGADSQILLGYANLYGIREIPKNTDQALEIFKKAVESGVYSGYSPLGKMYAYGIGVPQNNETAINYYKMGVKKQDPESMNGLGVMYLYGKGVPKDLEAAYKYFNQSASSNIPEAQYNLGLLYMTGEVVNKNLKKAYDYMSLAAQQGFPLAQYYLGRMHLHGLGAPKNCQAAVRFFKHVAERGHTTPLLDIAYRKYLEKKYDQSLHLYHQLAATGDEYAIQNAAYMFDNRIGTDSLFKKAILLQYSGSTNLTSDIYANICAFSLNHEAAKLGIVDSMIKVGDYYYFGKGTRVDYEQAIFSYKMSILKNSPRGAFNLGYAYEHGIGVEKDFEASKLYYNKAIQYDENSYIPVKLAIIKLNIKMAYKNLYTRLIGGVTFKDFSQEDSEKSRVEIEKSINQKIQNILNIFGNPNKLWEKMKNNELLSIIFLLILFIILGMIRTLIIQRF